MPLTRLAKHLRPRRAKEFGAARGIPLDRNAKARIRAYVKGYNARYRQEGRQHRGPITWAYERVLMALLYGFHNSADGRCFPAYEAIAERAQCHRDTVYEAIKALEAAGILTWVNRIFRVRERIPDLFGKWAYRWRIVRTSNAYLFRDPLPCGGGKPDEYQGDFTKSENTSGTIIPVFPSYKNDPQTNETDPNSPLERALNSYRQAMTAQTVSAA